MSAPLPSPAPAVAAGVAQHEARSFAPWIGIATALSVSSVIVYPWLFPGGRAAPVRRDRGNQSALGLIFGPAYDLSTVDGFNAWRSLSIGGFLTALGVIFIVVKASRGQEDSGQAELLASGVLGREARLLTALLMAGVCALAVGVVSFAFTVLCGGAWGRRCCCPPGSPSPV